MHPILLEIPGLHVTVGSYNTLIALAVVVCLWIGPRWAEALEGLDRGQTRRALLLLGLAVFAGGRLHFVLNQWQLFAHRPLAALEIWSGGMHAAGAIAALAAAGPLVLRWLAIPVGRFADGIVPTIGVGIAIARLGCFSQGCCFGTPCRWLWCVTFPRAAYVYDYHASLGLLPAGAVRSAPIHPLQLYFAAAGLLLTGIALWLHPRRRYEGQVGLVVLVVYGISAAVLEFFRADYYPRRYWGPLPQLEWMALGLTAAALLALGAAELLHRRGGSARKGGGMSRTT